MYISNWFTKLRLNKLAGLWKGKFGSCSVVVELCNYHGIVLCCCNCADGGILLSEQISEGAVQSVVLCVIELVHEASVKWVIG